LYCWDNFLSTRQSKFQTGEFVSVKKPLSTSLFFGTPPDRDSFFGTDFIVIFPAGENKESLARRVQHTHRNAFYILV
jgi:hypothetical protein